jgi:TRAP-type uncharacterized transport system substrate-binding protein
MDIKKTALFFAIMVITVGCISNPSAVTPTENIDIQPATSTPPSVYKFAITTGAINSDWYAEGNRLSLEINAQIPTVFSDVKETDSLMENVDLLTSGKAGLTFVYDYHVVLANQGKLMSAFPDAPIEKISIKCGTEITRPIFPDYAESARIVLPLFEEQVYIIAADVSGITSINELKGKHISTGEAGSATEQQARFIFAGLGIDWKTEFIHEQFDLSTAIHALENGEIDAFMWSGYSPSTELSDLLDAPEAKFKLLPIAADEDKTILQTAPGIFHQSQISAGLYASLQEGVETIATTVVLAAMEDFPEEHVTEILTTFFTPSSVEWKSSLSTKPEESIVLLSPEAKTYLHQGAVDYFADQGALK